MKKQRSRNIKEHSIRLNKEPIKIYKLLTSKKLPLRTINNLSPPMVSNKLVKLSTLEVVRPVVNT